MADINPQQQEIMDKWYEAISSATKEMGPLASEERQLAEATKKTKDRLTQFGEATVDFTKTIGGASKSFLDASEGTAKYGRATRDVTGAIGDLVGKIPYVGKAFGGLIKIFGGLTSAALDQNDALIKGYQTLSDFGAIDTRGIDGLFKDLERVGLTAVEFEKFGKILNRVRPDLAALGGDVAKGKKVFVDTMSDILGGTLERDLRAIGYTTESISENAATMLAREARLGNLQGKNQKDITHFTGLYLKELSELTALTGLSREEAQQKRDAMLSDARFSDKMNELREKDAKAYEHAMKGFLVLEKEMGEEYTRGIKDIFRTGTLSTDAAARAFTTSGGAVMDLVASLKNSNSQLTGPGGALSKFGKDFDKTYKGSFEIAAQYSDEFSREMYGSTQAIFGARKMQLYDTVKVQDLIDAQNQKGNKDRLNIGTQMAMDERKLRLAANQMLYETTHGLIAVFGKLVTAATEFGKVMAKIVDKFTSLGLFGMKPTNLTELFIDNLEDATAAITTKESELPKLLEKRALLEKDLIQTQEKKKKADEEVAKATTEVGKAIAKTRFGDPLGHQDRIDKLENELKENKQGEQRLKKEISSLSQIKDKKNVEVTDKTAASAKAAEAAGTQSSAESRRLGMTAPSTEGVAAGNKEKSDPASKPKENPASAQKILDFIAKKESGGDYNIQVGGKNDVNLTGMSIAEILKYQDEMKAKGMPSTALGKYQIIQGTLKGLVKQGVVTPADKFDAATQEKLGMALLEGRDYSKYKSGAITAEQFADNLAKEWAALPTQSGKSYYDKVGNNKALVSRQDLMAQIEQAATGGVFAGPTSGYPVMLHGNEIVIPMKDFQAAMTGVQNVEKSPLGSIATPAPQTNNMDQLMSQVSDMISSKMDELVEQMRISNRTQEELLQYTRA